MNFEMIKKEFIRLKQEELEYIDEIARISSNKILNEEEKIEIYRKLEKYKEKLSKILKELFDKILEDKKLTSKNLNDVIIEFNVNKDFLSSILFSDLFYRKRFFEELGVDIDISKFRLFLSDLVYNRCQYRGIDLEIIQNGQKLIEKPIYIFTGYYDSSEDCYGPCFGNPEDYLFGVYENITTNEKKEISKREMQQFENGNVIMHSKKNVYSSEIKKIFNEELLNFSNRTLNDCVMETRKRIEELNYIRSPEYKEQVLLQKIHQLYRKVKGEEIKKEILYNGKFLSMVSELYKLPNGKVVKKEKVVKNNGKNAVIVIAITQENQYIITFQNRIKDEMVAEFPSGYIESDENPIDAAKRELKEETGYVTDDLFILDEVYSSPGIDNSKTYIVIAKNCVNMNEKYNDGTELVSYGLFSENELNYLVSKNIMCGAINKLAYYNLINNVERTSNIGSKCKMQLRKVIPLDYLK